MVCNVREVYVVFCPDAQLTDFFIRELLAPGRERESRGRLKILLQSSEHVLVARISPHIPTHLIKSRGLHEVKL